MTKEELSSLIQQLQKGNILTGGPTTDQTWILTYTSPYAILSGNDPEQTPQSLNETELEQFLSPLEQQQVFVLSSHT